MGWRFYAAIIVFVVCMVLLKRIQLDGGGRYWFGPNPAHAVILANRSNEPWMFEITWDGHAAMPKVVPPRARVRYAVPHPDSGTIEVTARRVLTEGPDCVDRVMEWTTVADESYSIELAEAGNEVVTVQAAKYPAGAAGVSFHASTPAPVLVYYSDLAGIGGISSYDDDGNLVPNWVGLGIDSFVGGTSLYSNRQARLRYRITALAAPAKMTLVTTDDSSHEVVVDREGSVMTDELSLRTWAGY